MSLKDSGRSEYLRSIYLASLLSLSLVTLSLLTHSANAASKCKLAPLGEFPVNMQGPRLVVPAKINGTAVKFTFDSGAFYSMMSTASASQLQLNLSAAPISIRGIGGKTDPTVAVVKLLEIGNFVVHNVQFLVAGTDVGGETVGLLGQNLFRIGDIEYDLGKGEIRLWHSADCENTPLAYWAKPGEAYSLMTIAAATGMKPSTEGSAYVNGAQISVIFDTGASTSILSMKSAERAGVTPESPGVVEAGYSYGIGKGLVKTYIGNFSSFKIGDEEIHNAKLRFGDLGQGFAGMLLGADFFLSHRIYVAGNERQLYFTYNGGPVFNLSKSSAKPEAAAPTPVPSNAATPGDAASPTAAQAPTARTPDDSLGAAELGRRGAASVSRHDYESALTDLTRATELDPANTENFYQLGLVHLQTGKRDAAAGDFNHVLELKPDHVPALMWRAQIRIAERNIPSARIDLDAVDQSAAKEADVRFELAHVYAAVDLFDSALKQWDLWIRYHDQDPRVASALNGRCWDRASLGVDLAVALKDCNAAMKLTSNESEGSVLDSRAFVYLRLNEYGKAIADYDARLKLNPKSAWSLYGRGIARIRENKTVEGRADVAQAVAIAPNIAEQFKKRGIAP
jgi:tetratricopeptide (TPR) repeat protein/predicted aspartyl protease